MPNLVKKKAWKSRYIVLSKNKISIYRKQSDMELKEQIFIDDIAGLSNYDEPKKSFCFAFTAKGELFVMQVNNLNEHDLWLSAIEIRRKENKRKPVKTLLESDRVTFVLYDQDILWSANSNLILNLWDTKTAARKKEKKLESAVIGADFYVSCMLRPAGTDIMCIAVHKSILRVDTKTFNQIPSLEGHTAKINGLAEICNTFVSCSDDGALRLWNSKNFECIKIVNLNSPLTCISTVLSRIWVCTETRQICILDQNLKLLKTFDSTHKELASSLTYIPATKTVWSASWDSTFIIWA